MNEDTNPVEQSTGSEPVNSPMSIDDAVAAYTSEPDEVEQVEAPDAVESNSEPDDLALAEGEEEAEPQIEAQEATLASDDMVVDVDGEKIPVADLKKSRLLEADYTRSKQVLTQERAGLQELGRHFTAASERIAEYLFSKLPSEPDPQLAFTNPNLHYQQKMLHDASMAEMMQVLQVQQGAKDAVGMLDENEFKARMSEADSEIIKQMPHLKDQKRFEAFTRRVQTGAKQYGFTDAEINSTADPRIRLMAYDAAYGREARANAAKAKAKVQEAKPMLPVQRSKTHATDQGSQLAAAQKRFDANPTPDNAAALMAFDT